MKRNLHHWRTATVADRGESHHSCRLYRQRRDAMVAAIRRPLPLTIHVDPPQGGLFCWLRLPAGCSCLDLLSFALEAGGEFAPGTRFFPNPAEGEGYLRLNFATCTPAEIDEGIRRLTQALHCCTASSSNQHRG